MTDSTDRVLASIDEAIDGYVSGDDDVSYDAMRWRPDEPAEPHTGQVHNAYWAPVGTLADGPGAWTPLGHVADGGFVYGESSLTDHAQVARRLNDRITVAVNVDVEAMMAAFASVGRAIKQVGAAFGTVAKRNHPAVARLQYGDDYRRHRRACRLCNPTGNPKPLAVNGSDYRRRTRARRRRNRR